MLLCELLCVLSACVFVSLYEFSKSNGSTNKKKHLREKKIHEHCFPSE